MLYNYNYFSIIIFCFTICYEELLKLHVHFILSNYDVIHIIMISMHDVRFTHS